MTYIDLRSDTVTTPTAAMRKAMATADVGDDGRLLPDGHYGDPTVRELEELVADLLGKPAALLTATGVQANLIALRTWCERGDLVALGESSHLMRHEAGAFDPGLLGLRAHQLADHTGFPDTDGLEQFAPRLLCLENTHNAAGGIPWHPALWQQHDSLPVHLDGARLYNAAVALNTSLKEMAQPGDSVMMCLSKGLGAPVGSILAGDTEWISRARDVRRLMGGQMRQAGVIAAAGLCALSDAQERLARDHEHASMLAHALAELPGLMVQADTVATNMVLVQTTTGPAGKARLVDYAGRHGVLLAGPGVDRLRIVLHHDVTAADLERVVGTIREGLQRS